MKMRSQHKMNFTKNMEEAWIYVIFCKSLRNRSENYPAINAEIQEDDIVYKNHISIAVGTDRGQSFQ